MLGLDQKKIIGLLTIGFVLTGANLLWKIGPGKTQTRDLSKYTVIAEKGKLPSLITASGKLQAQNSLNVNPHRQGIIESVYVKEGEKVKKDQLLAKIDSRDYQFRLDELITEFETTKASFERRKNLFIEGGISKEKYEDFRKSFLISKARLEQIKVEGDEFLIKAPMKGVITARYAEPGTYVSPTSVKSVDDGTSKSSVVEISQGIEVISKVPESDIGRIKIDQVGITRVEAFPDERFTSVVSDIAPRAIRQNNVTSFEVKLSLIEPPQKLRIGMTADIEFQTGESQPRTIVPTVAIVTKDGEPGLLIVGKNKEPLFQKVELGPNSGNKTAIIKGIQPGEKVFIDMPPWSKKKRN